MFVSLKNLRLNFTGNAKTPGINVFTSLNPPFYHLSEPVILPSWYINLARHNTKADVPAVHHCTGIFCAVVSDVLGKC